MWPAWFPASCPPTDAVPASGVFYRLAANNPPVEEDFRSWMEEEMLGLRRRTWSVGRDCQASACSVFDDEAEVLRLREASGATRSRSVVSGDITGSGVMKHTPSGRNASHHSWWRPLNDTAWTRFA
ncbi:hypothetical protein GA0004736_1682 [Curtobacterium sp. 9128]|nr:hypothetical protein GA0004736_1682 [Curtobacterium sp. 9128]